MGPSSPPNPNSTTCVNSKLENPNNQGNSKIIQKIVGTYLKEIQPRKNIIKITTRSSVDDLLRHTPEAVNESSTLDEEEVANNLDHTNR